MTKYSCLACREPIPEHPEGGVPAHGYVVANIVAEPAGVLLRDEFGAPATYYGRVVTRLVRRGCSRRECEEYGLIEEASQ